MLILREYPQLEDMEWVDNYDFEKSWTRKNPDAEIGQLDCAVAIVKTGGVMVDMCRLLKRSRAQVTTRINKDPHLSELAEDIAESFIDEVEKLHKAAALQGDLATQRFILTTLGKKRGYVTRQEQDVQAKTTVVIEKEDASL